MRVSPHPLSTAAYGHVVQFFDSDHYLIEKVAAFLGAGMRSGAAGIAIADSAHRGALRKSLDSEAAGAAEGSGPLIEFDAAEVLASILVDGTPDEALFHQVIGGIVKRASNGGGRSVRVYGELVALLCAQDRHPEALVLEAFWNDLARVLEFKLFCGYPMKLFESGDHALAFERVCDAHSLVYPAEGGAALSLGAAAGPTVAALQQKTRALNAEVARRRAAEAALQQRSEAFADSIANAAASICRVSADGPLAGATNSAVPQSVIRELVALLQQAPLGAIVLSGPEHRCEQANPVFEEMLGRRGLAGRNFVKAFPELVATELPFMLDRAYQLGEPFAVQAYMFALRRGGAGHRKTCCFRFSGQPLRGRSGAVYGAVMVITELADRIAPWEAGGASPASSVLTP